MKKLLFTILSILVISPSMTAQTLHWSHDENTQSSTSIIGFVYLDGVQLASDDYEIGAFVGEECRGNKRLQLYSQIPNIYWAWFNIFYETAGETATFKLYNHSTETEYNLCSNTLELGEEVVGELDNPYKIYFYSPFTKEIAGYGTSTGKDHYYLIASPIVNFAPTDGNGFLTSNYDLYYFDEAQDLEWINFKGNSPDFTTLEPGKGFLYASSTNTTLTFSAPQSDQHLYSGNGQVTLSKTDGVDFSGWNLVGNPFGQPAYIDREFYVMNPAGSEIIAGEGSTIETLQGIFVVASSNNEVMSFSTEAPSIPGERLSINLTQNRGEVIDRTIIRFGEGDQLPKFMLNPKNTKLYIPQGSKDFAVVHSAAEAEMPLNFKASKNGSYTLSVDKENLEMDYLHLIDNMTGIDVDLLQTPSYTFEASTHDYASRFKLVFSASEDGPSTCSGTFAFYNGSNWTVSNMGEATLQVVDVTGRTVSSETINGNATISLNQTPGVYMLRLVNGSSVKVQKVVVR